MAWRIAASAKTSKSGVDFFIACVQKNWRQTETLCRLTDFTLRNLGIATAWIDKDRDCCSFWNELAQQLQAFGDDRSSEKRYTSDVTARPIKTGNEAVFYGVRAVCKDDRDGGGFGLRCERGHRLRKLQRPPVQSARLQALADDRGDCPPSDIR